MAIMSMANGRSSASASGPARVEAAEHGLAIAVVQGGDALAQVGVAQRVRQDLEERLEALRVGGDARLAVDERAHAGLAGAAPRPSPR